MRKRDDTVTRISYRSIVSPFGRVVAVLLAVLVPQELNQRQLPQRRPAQHHLTGRPHARPHLPGHHRGQGTLHAGPDLAVGRVEPDLAPEVARVQEAPHGLPGGLLAAEEDGRQEDGHQHGVAQLQVLVHVRG